METKIKVSISKSTYEVLLRDCQLFEFYKDDGTLNRNAFINTLIVNYYEEFSAREFKFSQELTHIATKYNNMDADLLCDEVLALINRHNQPNRTLNETIVTFFKPTKYSQRAIDFIENVIMLQNQSTSSFYRNLFDSYASKPQNQRELIIFKENYKLVEDAINKGLKIYLTTTTSKNFREASVYKLVHSKEELFNYVLLEVDHEPATYRISRMKNVSILSSRSTFETKNIEVFKKLEQYGPQYPITVNENEPVVLRLSKLGEKLYQRIYLYRPEYDKKEGNLYYFNCSYNQVVFYFSRFGRQAIVISPESVRAQMEGYYRNAYLEYKNK